jgi:UDP-GlcNAc:undecaprenyl-phosphate GlcNAc-1-phosphate transferase
MSYGVIDLGLMGIFLAAAALSGFLTWRVRDYAIAHGWASGPQSDRHIHVNPIPRTGGIAVYTTFTLSLLTIWAAHRIFHLQHGGVAGRLLPLLMPATMIFLVGLWDDRRSLPAYVKLGFQIVAAIWLYEVGYGLQLSAILFRHGMLGWLALPATVLWVLWISNAFNLIDGLDGLAAGSALFSLIALFIVGVLHNNSESVMCSTLLAAAIFGFLRYNFNPATVFLGDSGSLFIGFMLSAISLAGYQSKVPTLVAIAIPMVAFGLPLVETVVSIFRRLIGGTPIFQPDRNHIHHRLLEMGMSHRRAVIFLYGVSGLCGLVSLFLLYPGSTSFAFITSIAAIVFIAGVQRLGYPEFLEIGRLAKRTIEQNQVIVNNLKVRSAARMLQKATTAGDIEDVLGALFLATEFLGYQVVAGVRSKTGSTTEHALSGNWNDDENAPIWRWEFELGLREKVGALVLFRSYERRSVMFDADILAAELIPALSRAVMRAVSIERVRVASEERSAEPTQLLNVGEPR